MGACSTAFCTYRTLTWICRALTNSVKGMLAVGGSNPVGEAVPSPYPLGLLKLSGLGHGLSGVVVGAGAGRDQEPELKLRALVQSQAIDPEPRIRARGNS